MIYDIAIIGGGIVGLATALALTRAGVSSLTVLEAENQLAAHQTGNNSGVIHSGLYYKPGSVKAQTCVSGREALYRFCAEHGLPHECCGKIVVATHPAELPRLDSLEERGRANGLTLRRLAAGELREYEPHVAGIAGLWVAETGIVDYVHVTRTYARLVEQAGGEIRRNARVSAVIDEGAALRLVTGAGEVLCRRLINCAGLQSDRIARLCGFDPGLRITPFRGEYYQLTPQRSHLVRNLIYPVPDPQFPFLGVHFTRLVHGGVEAGPNAVLAFKREGYRRSSFRPTDVWEIATNPAFWRLAQKYWRTGIGEFYRSFSKRAFVTALQRLAPAVQSDDLLPAGAGVRAQALADDGALVDDFRIIATERMIHVLNAPSPAATASLAIGESIAQMAKDKFQA
jgi:L-2-hydroxyglutarate oxidase